MWHWRGKGESYSCAAQGSELRALTQEGSKKAQVLLRWHQEWTVQDCSACCVCSVLQPRPPPPRAPGLGSRLKGTIDLEDNKGD